LLAHAGTARAHADATFYHTLGAGPELLLGTLAPRPDGAIAVERAPGGDLLSPLRALLGGGDGLAGDGRYALRLASNLGVPPGGRARHVVASLPAGCAAQLLLPASDDPAATPVLLVHVSAAGMPMALEAERADGAPLSCDRALALRRVDEAAAAAGDKGGAGPPRSPALRVRIVSPAVAPPVTITTQAPGQAQALQAQQQAQAQAQLAAAAGANGTAGNGTGAPQRPPPPEKTFLQKNGLFIVGGIMMALNVLLRPEVPPPPAAAARPPPQQQQQQQQQRRVRG